MLAVRVGMIRLYAFLRLVKNLYGEFTNKEAIILHVNTVCLTLVFGTSVPRRFAGRMMDKYNTVRLVSCRNRFT